MIPCKDCITLAICKHKPYSDLMECEMIRGHLYNAVKDMRLLMINRKPGFHNKVQDIDKLFGSSHDVRLVSRRRRSDEYTL